MRYAKFEIENFKGIKKATIVIPKEDSTAVALIGLNESGKTTILQAIYSFSLNDESKVLFERDKAPAKPDIEFVPRDKISTFTGDVVVKATIEMSEGDRRDFIKYMKDNGSILNEDTVPNSFSVKNINSYENGIHKKYQTLWYINPLVKSGKQKNFRRRTDAEWGLMWRYLKSALPDIAYFPTFVFDLPDKIYLHGHDDDAKNLFYKKIIEDVFSYQGDGIKIDQNIISRIHSSEFLVNFSEFLLAFWGSSSQQRIVHAMDLASATLTKVILDSWHEIFDEQLGEKKIELDWKPESDQSGSNEHTIYVKFQVKQGTDRFDISDRSLGFRWFFCFLLFTQFRSHRKGGQGTLFLFDEPASNLHAKAQERLLKCFADISKSPNALIYSTHSQHMINPAWIDFAYIVENKEIDYDKSSDTKHVTSNSTDISAVRYQQFVNSNPGKASYYQPVLDRLEVRPSLMELRDGAALVEGKSDFYILRYMADHLNKNVVIVPAFGSTTFDALIPLLMGLARQFYIILDSDASGADAMKGYGKFEIGDERKVDLKSTTGFSEPEKFLAEDDVVLIQTEMGLSRKPTKKQIMRFFREALATGKSFQWSEQFRKAAAAVLDKISES